MPVFHYLHVRAFVHETEDPEKVRAALTLVAEPAKVAWEETKMEGSHGNAITLMEAEVKSAQAERALFRRLEADAPGAGARLLREMPRRLDEHLNFHLRLDKQEAVLGRLALTTGDDAILVRGKVRAFPGAETAESQAKRALEGFLGNLDPRT